MRISYRRSLSYSNRHRLKCERPPLPSSIVYHHHQARPSLYHSDGDGMRDRRDSEIVCQEDSTNDWLLDNSKHSAKGASANNMNKQKVCKYCGDDSRQSEISDNTQETNQIQDRKLSSGLYNQGLIYQNMCTSCPVIV